MAMPHRRNEDQRRRARTADEFIESRREAVARVSDAQLDGIIRSELAKVDEERLLRELHEMDERRKRRSAAHVPNHAERDRPQPD